VRKKRRRPRSSPSAHQGGPAANTANLLDDTVTADDTKRQGLLLLNVCVSHEPRDITQPSINDMAAIRREI